jgi:hypothetical protein
MLGPRLRRACLVSAVIVSVAWPGGTAAQQPEMVVPKPPDPKWETFLMPGAQYSLYLPSAKGIYGTFHGFSFELLLAAWIHQNENRGPSHGRVYINTDLLGSTRDGVGKLLTYTLGVDLSFERNARREFLIPYYGLDVGGLYLASIGHVFTFNPFVGVRAIGTRNVFVNLTAGYLFPTDRLDDLVGWRFKAGVDFSLW